MPQTLSETLVEAATKYATGNFTPAWIKAHADEFVTPDPSVNKKGDTVEFDPRLNVAQVGGSGPFGAYEVLATSGEYEIVMKSTVIIRPKHTRKASPKVNQY